jgi:hypothetical protein
MKDRLKFPTAGLRKLRASPILTDYSHAFAAYVLLCGLADGQGTTTVELSLPSVAALINSTPRFARRALAQLCACRAVSMKPADGKRFKIRITDLP